MNSSTVAFTARALQQIVLIMWRLLTITMIIFFLKHARPIPYKEKIAILNDFWKKIQEVNEAEDSLDFEDEIEDSLPRLERIDE